MHEIEVIFRGVSSLRILKVLLENKDRYVSKYFIIRESGVSNPNIVLRKLVELGWVKVIEFNGYKRYRVNMENRNVRMLYEFFKGVRYISKY